MPSFSRYSRTIVTLAMLLCGFIFAAPLRLFSSRQEIDGSFEFLDWSWQLDVITRLHQGQLAGRDFIYTCGPAFQLFHALGLVLPPGDVGSAIRFYFLIDSVAVALALWGLLGLFRLSLWRQSALYIAWWFFWCTEIFPWITVRNCLALYIVAYGASLLAQPKPESRFGRWRQALVWGLPGPLLLLYTVDCGLFTLLGILGVSIALTLLGSRLRTEPALLLKNSLRRYLLAFLTGSLGLAILLLALPGWRGFIYYSWQTVQGYQWAMASPLSLSGAMQVGALLVLVLVVLGGLARHIRRELANGRALEPDELALLAAGCFAVLSFRAALTRSDQSHLLASSFPALFFLFALLPAFAVARGHKLALVLVPGVLAPLTVTGLPGAAGSWNSTKSKISTLATASAGRTTLFVSSKAVLQILAATDQLPGKNLYVWPNLTLINAMSGKLSPNFTVQTYAAHTTALEEATIRNLEADPNMPVLIPGGDIPLDNISSISRTPLISHFLLDHFMLTRDYGDGLLLLRHRPASMAVHWEDVPLNMPPLNFQPGPPLISFGLIPAGSPACTDSNLYTMRVRIAKTRTFPAGKPGLFYAIFELLDGTQLHQRLLVPQDGAGHDVLVTPQPLSGGGFKNAFAPVPITGSGATVRRIGFFWKQMDVLSAVPQEIEVSQLAVLRPTRGASSGH